MCCSVEDEDEEVLRAVLWRLVGSGVTAPGDRVGDWVGCSIEDEDEDEDEDEEVLRAGHWRLVGSGVSAPGYRVGDWVGYAG